jgi:hypothetical protein
MRFFIIFEKKLTMKKFFIIFFTVYLKFYSFNSCFVPNKGQWPEDVLFGYSVNGMKAFITKTGIIYDFYKYTDNNFSLKTKFQKRIYRGHVVRFELLNPNKHIGTKKIIAPSDFEYHYINNRGNFTVSEFYDEITVTNIYDGIDVRYYIQENYLRFDFIVHPGANPNKIKLFTNDCPLLFNNDGLLLNTSIGSVKFMDLKTYQNLPNEKKLIPSMLKVDHNVIGFDVKEYDKSRTLIIDPLVFSTFIGSSSDEGAYNVGRDASGNLYICGYTPSSSFPTTTGAYDQTHNGSDDGFISKFNSNGSSLIYSTFIGGSAADYIYWMSVDNTGEVYACGETSSLNFPVTSGVFGGTKSTGTDAMIFKLNASGGALIYSTYLGGNGNDYAYGIVHDTLGNAYVCGATSSNNFTVVSAYDFSHNGLHDAFVTKISQGANSVIYSTYLGGSSDDFSYAIRLASNNEVILTGCTFSSLFPTTATAYDNSYNTNGDVFVTRLGSGGNTLIYSTFIGGLGEDCAYALALDPFENVYLTGYTDAGSYPVTSGAYDNSFNGGLDVIVSKLNNVGTILMNSTFFGGSSSDYGYGIGITKQDEPVVTGYIASSGVQMSSNAYDNSYNGGTYDGFVLRLNSSFSSMVYGSYIGGGGLDGGQSVITDNFGYAYLCGFASSTFPVTAGAYDITYNGGNYDGFLLKICTGLNPTVSVMPSVVCQNKVLSLTGQPGGLNSYLWTGPGSFSATGQIVSYTNIPLSGSGIYTLTVQDANGCTGTAVSNSVTVLPSPNTSVTLAGNTLTANQSGASYQWHSCSTNSAVSGATNQAFTPSVSGSFYVVVQLSGGCSDTSSCISVTITSLKDIINENLIFIYPNPSNGKLQIITPNFIQLQILDIQGKLIHTFTATPDTQTYDFNLPDGVYIIEDIDGGLLRKKLVIQK